jgi:fibronectin-binding autotransporter adhesin
MFGRMAYVSVKRPPRLLAAVLLAGTCLSPIAASAQIWIGGNGPGFETGANWSTGAPPTNVQTGTFGSGVDTSVSITTSTSVGGIEFSAGASAYTVDVSLGAFVSIGSNGLSNLSGNIQNFTASGLGTIVVVSGSATANNIAFNFDGSELRMQGTTSLGNATVTMADNAALTMQQGASGGTAAVTLSGGWLIITALAGAGTTVGSIAGGSGIISLGSKTLTVGGNNQSTTYGGRIEGSGGSLVKEGTGSLTLSGNSTYSGGTSLNAGTLAVGHNNALGTGALAFSNGTALQASANGLSLGNAMTLNGTNTVNTQTNTLTLNGVIGGTGSLTKSGTGTLILGGANTYSGGTTVSAGTLQGTTTSLQGSITNNAAVVFAQDGNGTYSGGMSGTGSLTKSGGGTVTLTGANAYQGGTTISGGTLAINNASALGTGLVLLSGGNLTGVANLTFANDITFTAGAGVIAAATLTTLTLAPNTLSFGLIPNTVMTFGSAADAGTIVYSAATSFITNVPFSAVVAGGTLRAGANTFGSLTGNDRATTVVNAGATLDFNDFSSTVANLQGTGSVLTGASAATAIAVREGNFSGTIGGAGQLTKTGTGTLVLSGANTYSGGTTVSGGILQGTSTSLQGAIANNANVTFDQGFTGTYAGAMSGSGSLTKSGTGTLVLAGTNIYSGGTTVSGGILQGNTASLQGNILNNASVVFEQATNGTYGGTMSGAGMLTKTGAGTLILGGSNSYSGGTIVSGGILQGTTANLQGNIRNNASVVFNQATSGTYAGSLSGTGSVVIQGGGVVNLIGTNSYIGGTTISGTTAQGNSASLQGNILNNGSVVFNQTTAGTYAGAMSGSGGMTLQGGGILGMTGSSTYTGPTTVSGSTLVVNGSLASTVTLDSSSMIGGAGTIGGLVSNGATLAPGNSMGTLTVTGNFTQTGGTYQVEANAQGQSDRVNVTGNATISGGTVRVTAASGSYGNSTTYTILNATAGLSGAYSGVTSNFAFLTPSLSYNANNVFLILALQGAAFSGFGGNTVNQRSVGYALDQSYANASSDFATVVGALAGLNTQQGPWALNQISGQPYADLGSFNVASNALFMNALGHQMALARGSSGSGQRQALAQACDVEACDATSAFSVWGSLLGGVGSVQGNGNSSTFTYNVGGTAAGIDYRLTPNMLVGVSAGYSTGTQWVDSFQGKGWSNTVSVAAYASFTQLAFYVDALAGYAYSNNQMQRQISVPNLQPRTANGSTGANQFLAQVEAGYVIPVYAPAAATLTPFARFQTSSINQAAFSEWGANSLSLNVAQQATSSVRTTFGADLAAAIGQVDLGLRLGWLHEYANTARPITAAFAGAPSASFTVYGATPQRDAAVIGFQASANVAAATQLYMRYDGEIASGSDNHTLNVGLRLSW